ncbi:uncharacterized protein LOC135202009 isoform X2 [Macrobrachium nipponense]|uniref:uncharacterized protein LOC135202009 isoform X2 n=1 Tax=Macrobrachium nipponense TaxID=159736 RepID=UPI0030C7F7A6
MGINKRSQWQVMKEIFTNDYIRLIHSVQSTDDLETKGMMARAPARSILTNTAAAPSAPEVESSQDEEVFGEGGISPSEKRLSSASDLWETTDSLDVIGR